MESHRKRPKLSIKENEYHAAIYRNSESIYYMEGVTHLLVSFLKNMILLSKSMSEYKEGLLLSCLIKVCKSLHLTEMEVALWSLCIESLKWNSNFLQLQDHLLFSAIEAKEQLLIDPTMIQWYHMSLVNSDAALAKRYEDWNARNAMKPCFTPIEINNRYSVLRYAGRRLGSIQDEGNLEGLVDCILSSIPSSTGVSLPELVPADHPPFAFNCSSSASAFPSRSPEENKSSSENVRNGSMGQSLVSGRSSGAEANDWRAEFKRAISTSRSPKSILTDQEQR
eukprot:TRINITY_DN4413_c0_g1_i10.p1 TRINITY_DN4413_c0_g1~~TRINITY_DN4413_c0_g1_i10.p1  ORF type:complete len:281 (-),score=15.39 TRINITY_DN4413_c0_g1_i10:123-965(-)